MIWTAFLYHLLKRCAAQNALTAMSEAAGTFEPCLEGLFVASSRLRDYHCSTLLALEDEVTAGLSSNIQRLTDSLRIQVCLGMTTSLPSS